MSTERPPNTSRGGNRVLWGLMVGLIMAGTIEISQAAVRGDWAHVGWTLLVVGVLALGLVLGMAYRARREDQR